MAAKEPSAATGCLPSGPAFWQWPRSAFPGGGNHQGASGWGTLLQSGCGIGRHLPRQPPYLYLPHCLAVPRIDRPALRFPPPPTRSPGAFFRCGALAEPRQTDPVELLPFPFPMCFQPTQVFWLSGLLRCVWDKKERGSKYCAGEITSLRDRLEMTRSFTGLWKLGFLGPPH